MPAGRESQCQRRSSGLWRQPGLGRGLRAGEIVQPQLHQRPDDQDHDLLSDQLLLRQFVVGPSARPIKANSPWSGHYEVWLPLWAMAHTTQFAQPGWRYLDGACGVLKEGGSYVCLRSPKPGGDYSVIIETGDAKTPQTLALPRDRRAGGRDRACLAEQRAEPVRAPGRHSPGRRLVYGEVGARLHLLSDDDHRATQGEDRDSAVGAISHAVPGRLRELPARTRWPGISPTRAAPSRWPSGPTAASACARR